VSYKSDTALSGWRALTANIGKGAPGAEKAEGLGTAPVDPYAGQRFDMQSGGPIQANQGWDFTSPGAAEQFFNYNQNRWMGGGAAGDFYGQNAGQLGSPGAGEQYWQQNQGALQGATASQQALDKFGEMPGFGDYYEGAQNRTMASMNDQLAARGMFGTSQGVDQLSQATTDLNAQRANREADFGLAQAGLGGQLAGQADSQRMAQWGLGMQGAANAQNMMQGRLGQGFGMAGQLDQMQDARLMGGMNAAAMAQQARAGRGQNYFGNLMQMGGATSGTVFDNNNMGLGMDYEQMMEQNAAALGVSREEYNSMLLKEKKHLEEADSAAGWITGGMGMGGGGKGG